MGDASAAANNVNTEYDDSIIGMIKRQINNSRFAPATPEELQLDHVLSSVPYRDMLQSLFGTTCGPSPNLPIITTMAGARAAVQAIQALRSGHWQVFAIQDYFPALARTRAEQPTTV